MEMKKEEQKQQLSQELYQEEKKTQTVEQQEKSRSVNFTFQFETQAEEKREETYTVISDELNEALCKQRSKEYLGILKKQAISAMSDEQIKRIIAREIVVGGAASMEDVVNLSAFMEEEESAEAAPISEEEQAMMEEMSTEDVEDFLRMLNESFSETIASEELKLKESLVELDKKAIDESYHLAKCPICPAHDIHILPKNHRLFFCHFTHHKLTPVFEEAKKLLFNGEASFVHVYKGCAFVIGKDGAVKKRIDVVEEPMELVIRNGWEELP